LLDLCGDAEGARTALVQATDSGHAFLAPRAALALGLIRAIFRQARSHAAPLYKDRLPPMRFLCVVQ
jgi:hypothetical protein